MSAYEYEMLLLKPAANDVERPYPPAAALLCPTPPSRPEPTTPSGDLLSA